jgi:butyrate kinase
MLILAINPGSTSTKIAIFKNKQNIFTHTIAHSRQQLMQFNHIIDQYDFRKKLILQLLNKHNYQLTDFNAIVGRGGLLKPIASGVYRVNAAMIHDLKIGYSGEHASNLGGLLAYELAQQTKNPDNAFIVDPVVVDEMEDIARISGMPEIPRRSIIHALNQKAVAYRYAKENNTQYEKINLIVAHMGGGISIGAHCKGRIIDTGSGNLGDGTFTPERSGGIPIYQFAELCFSKKYSFTEIKKMIIGNGGLLAYLGTNNIQEVKTRIKQGDKKAKLILSAMIYQIAKEIGAYATVLKGKIDAIILTGGIAYDKDICKEITASVKFIGKIVIYPGEDEMRALAENVYNALTKQLPIKQYIVK